MSELSKQIAHARNWKIYCLRGLWHLCARRSKHKAAMCQLVDMELADMGAEPEGQRQETGPFPIDKGQLLKDSLAYVGTSQAQACAFMQIEPVELQRLLSNQTSFAPYASKLFSLTGVAEKFWQQDSKGA